MKGVILHKAFSFSVLTFALISPLLSILLSAILDTEKEMSILTEYCEI